MFGALARVGAFVAEALLAAAAEATALAPAGAWVPDGLEHALPPATEAVAFAGSGNDGAAKSETMPESGTLPAAAEPLPRLTRAGRQPPPE